MQKSSPSPPNFLVLVFLLPLLSLLITAQKCFLEKENKYYDLTKLQGPQWPILNDDNSFTSTSHFLSICKSNTNETNTLGLFNSDLTLTNYDNGRKNNLKLVYTNGDRCGSEKAQTKTTTINFVCVDWPHLSDPLPKLTHVSSDECNYEIYWRTSEACEKNKANITLSTCQIPGFIDLTPLKEDMRVDLDDGSTFFTRLCSLNHKCSMSHGCLIHLNKSMVSLGSRLNSTQYINDTNELYLSFIDGNLCDEAKNVSYSFQVTLKCWWSNKMNQQRLMFIRRSSNGCHYYFELLTSSVCRASNEIMTRPSFGLSCKISTYDLNPLKERLFEIENFKVSICRPLTNNECNRSLNRDNVCVDGGFSDTLKLDKTTGLISLDLNQTRIEFYCNSNNGDFITEERLVYLYYIHSAKLNVMALYTHLVCDHGIDQCDFLDNREFSFSFSTKKTQKDNFLLTFRLCGSAWLWNETSNQKFSLGISGGKLILINKIIF
jgi:hypothetical protein